MRHDKSDLAEFDDDWDQPAYPGPFAASVTGDKFAPSFEKCGACDDNGLVVVARMAARTTKHGTVVEQRQFDNCESCNGIGYLNVPTDEPTKARLILSGNRSDLVVLMRARYRGGVPLFAPHPPHEVRTNRHALAVVEEDAELVL